MHISCLVDDSAEMRLQAWNWVVALRSLQSRCCLFVHHTPNALSPEQKALFEHLGTHLVEVMPFGQGPARYCNKIRQLSTPELLDTDYVILSDTDIVFRCDPADLAYPNAFRAKLVDLPNPSKAAWRRLFEDVGLIQHINEQPIEIEPNSSTFSTNFNGGLYILPASLAGELACRWEKYARICLKREDVLDRALHHSDQIGMGMALAELGAEIRPLPTGANLPTHLDPKRLGRIPPQRVTGLHYHSHTDNHGLPLTTGVRWIDEAITEARGVLDAGRRSAFSNSIFWDFRYSRFPALGSGLGSRGDSLRYKKQLLAQYFKSKPTGWILDVGCGDIESTRELEISNYIGIDISTEALNIAYMKRPDWLFQPDPVNTFPDKSFHFTICLDVLIHQPNKSQLCNLINEIIRVTRFEILFSAHERLQKREGISFNSYDAPKIFSKHPRVTEVKKIGAYRDLGVFIARICNH